MKVLVFGLGQNGGGIGSAKFFAEKGDTVRVTDLKNKEDLKSSIEALKNYPNIEYILGEHRYEDFDWADLIIKNPAVKPGNQYLDYAKQKGKRVETDMGILLEHVKPGQIIGVTGTKGKSTTASLIYEVLKQNLPVIANEAKQSSQEIATSPSAPRNDERVIFAGNIGKSVLDIIPLVKKESLVILELSSFQLEAFETHQVSPKFALITNIYPDHLNYYSSMEEYIEAKRTIAKYQSDQDILFLREHDPLTSQQNFQEGFKAAISLFATTDLPTGFKPNLQGEHNRENIAAALKVALHFSVDKEEALKVLESFKGVPFRQELIKEWHGVKIINDTAATGPDAGIAALKTFPNSILIAGGMNKNMDYKEYAKEVNERVKVVFFLEGDSTDLIISSLRSGDSRGSNLTRREALLIHGPYNDLEKLLNDVKDIVGPGDTILFSPAATSFNLFQNEFDRGRKFNTAVEKIFT